MMPVELVLAARLFFVAKDCFVAMVMVVKGIPGANDGFIFQLYLIADIHAAIHAFSDLNNLTNDVHDLDNPTNHVPDLCLAGRL